MKEVDRLSARQQLLDTQYSVASIHLHSSECISQTQKRQMDTQNGSYADILTDTLNGSVCKWKTISLGCSRARIRC
jgi:hypothetical protein